MRERDVLVERVGGHGHRDWGGGVDVGAHDLAVQMGLGPVHLEADIDEGEGSSERGAVARAPFEKGGQHIFGLVGTESLKVGHVASGDDEVGATGWAERAPSIRDDEGVGTVSLKVTDVVTVLNVVRVRHRSRGEATEDAVSAGVGQGSAHDWEGLVALVRVYGDDTRQRIAADLFGVVVNDSNGTRGDSSLQSGHGMPNRWLF